MRGARRSEIGSGTLLVIVAMSVLLVVGAAMGVVGAMFVDHRRAQSAADLAALAGAAALGSGADGCAAAQRVAARNDARLLSCSAIGRDLLVEVQVTGPHWLGQSADLRAKARAGPG